MAELGDMIGKLLEDPESMKTITSLLGSLGQDQPTQTESAPPSPDAIAGAGTVDAEKITGILKLLNGPPDERCRLLLALKPFVNPKRGERIEQSVKMLKLLRIAEQTGGFNIV